MQMIFKLINWFITFFDLALQTPQNIETHAYWIFHTRDKLSAGHIPFDFHYIFLIDAVLQGFCWSLNDLSSYGEKKKPLKPEGSELRNIRVYSFHWRLGSALNKFFHLKSRLEFFRV